jgi:hypothetical protein
MNLSLGAIFPNPIFHLTIREEALIRCRIPALIVGLVNVARFIQNTL